MKTVYAEVTIHYLVAHTRTVTVEVEDNVEPEHIDEEQWLSEEDPPTPYNSIDGGVSVQDGRLAVFDNDGQVEDLAPTTIIIIPKPEDA